nr:S-layer homology domain-containing protein [uncultured Agathobaculum sp.]
MKKRILSTLLAICMVVVMIPAAFAVQVSTPENYYWVTTPGKISMIASNGVSYMKDVFPGDMVWDRVENGSNEYYIELYRNGQKVDQTKHIFSLTEQSKQLSIEMFREVPRESGTYTFTLKALGDGKEYEDSDVVTSDAFEYTRPATQLTAPTNPRWDGATARWDEVEGADAYGIYWYFSKTADGDWQEAGSTWGFIQNSCALEDWVIEDCGAGYYAFEVRAMADNVTLTCPSELSTRSAVYSTDGATTSVSESLDQILADVGDGFDQGKVNAAVEAVKGLDSEELRVALEADKAGDGVTAQIDKLEDLTNVTLTKNVEQGFGIDEDEISLTGAKLNAMGNQVTFNITKPSQEIVVPAAYENTVQFDFELQGATVETDGDFSVPIKITMPVPANIDPSRLRILHYTEAGTYEEVIFPAITEKNGVYYATFVVKHFSPFVFAEATTAAMIGETPYYSLQDAIDAADSGAKIDLYRNSDDTVLKVANKSLTINCNTYELRSDVDWQLTNCTKSETKDEQGHKVIVITYTSGGSSSGGGGGSNSSSNKPTASVSGSGGKVTVANDGTVTITPDQGYQISKITVNGKEVDIPTNGKLTGLDKDDKVVVTFEKIPEEKPGTTTTPFTDIAANAWYADAVEYVYENGIMNGTSATSFSPNETTTRGMIVTMLHRLEDTPSAASSGFMDVAAGAWYADAVAWAAANGVVNGVSDTAFAPETAITREQLATILYRYAQLKRYDVSVSGNLSGYADASQISDYAMTAMQWANAAGLITGNTATTINPTGNATRAEVATILMRFCEKFA